MASKRSASILPQRNHKAQQKQPFQLMKTTFSILWKPAKDVHQSEKHLFDKLLNFG